ncbi:MAG: CAP domain-containing protein [Deltaproteobacteria bacterium]|nr:CAP domain-containing protein [Deltaproteobacteria bacterium]
MDLLFWVALWGQLPSLPAPAGDEVRGFDAVDSARRRSGGSACREDRRLTAAARDTSRALLEASDADLPDTAWTTFAARRLGVTDPGVRPFAVRYRRIDEALRRIREAPAAGDALATHCGIGVAASGETRVLTVLSVRRSAAIDPFPVRPALGQAALLSGRLSRGYEHPRVFVTRPDGTVERVLMLPRARGFAASLRFDEVGSHQIEVMADGASGPEPVAILGAWVLTPPPDRPVVLVRPDLPEDPATVAGRLHELVGVARARAGLPALRPDARLARIAREHAVDMRGSRFFGHVSPTRGSLADRMRAVGLWSPRVAENVARGPSAERIDTNVMASPAHRANVLDALLTHVGVGVAEIAAGDIIAVMVFATDPTDDR